MWKNDLWGIFPYSYIPFHGKSSISYLYTWWNMFCSIQRPFVTPLLLFSHVRPGSLFVMSNYHQASTLATEIWGQHHDGLKSIMWDTLTRHLWCVEWCRRHICWKAVWRGSGIQKMPLKRIFPSHSPGAEATFRAHHARDPPWCSPFPGDHKLCWKVFSVRTALVQKLVLGLRNYWGQCYFRTWIPKKSR